MSNGDEPAFCGLVIALSPLLASLNTRSYGQIADDDEELVPRSYFPRSLDLVAFFGSVDNF